jgi:hypothetical protein
VRAKLRRKFLLLPSWQNFPHGKREAVVSVFYTLCGLWRVCSAKDVTVVGLLYGFLLFYNYFIINRL